jgi:uncharacterized membrane-anchored protein YitT (DUF2179 family)
MHAQRQLFWSNLLKHLSIGSLWQIFIWSFTIALGATIAALGYSLFQVPFNIAAGGLMGIGIIVNHFTGLPVGTLYFVLNLPLLIVGFLYLGRWRFLLSTLLAVVVFSITADLFTFYLPTILAEFPITDDMLLSAVYAGMVGGIGNGLVYRASGTLGGTAVVGRIIQRNTGFPLSQIFLYTDTTIIVAAGIVFGWELALHAMLTLFLGGLASDFTLEGPSAVRTATIITDQPLELTQALMTNMHRGVSQWPITGGYTGNTHFMLMCTIYRSQVGEVRQLVNSIDPHAFIVIGTAQQAMGASKASLRR